MMRKITFTATQTAQCAAEGDYRNEAGLLMCGICRTPKEVDLAQFGFGIQCCICRCESEKDKAERARLKEQQARITISRMRSEGIQDPKMAECLFARDDGRNPETGGLARRYAEYFEEIRQKNCGLLLYGEPGTGKSFYAGCIANALISKGIPVLVTSITRILNQLFSAGDKQELLREICHYDLLVIDDIGSERSTDYAAEQLYTVIDERYKSNRPTIITTNYSPRQLQSVTDIRYRRIYDRILEMCTPVRVEGERRREVGHNKAKLLSQILYGKDGAVHPSDG